MNTFENIHSKEDLQDNYLLLSRCDSALGNYKEANQFYSLYNIYKDSIYEEKSNNELTKQQIKFETEKVEKEIKSEQEKRTC